MRVTKDYIQQIINEEVEKMIQEGEIDEGVLDRLKATGASAWQAVKGGVKSKVAGGVGRVAGMAGLDGVQQAAQTAKSGIQADTANKQKLVKLQKIVLPKANDLLKDLKIVFEKDLNDPYVKALMAGTQGTVDKLNKMLQGAGLVKGASKRPEDKPPAGFGSDIDPSKEKQTPAAAAPAPASGDRDTDPAMPWLKLKEEE